MLPKRSSGVWLAPFEDRFVAYHQVAETVHWLNASAGVLLAHCDGSTSRDDLVNVWAEETGVERAEIDAGLRAALDDFVSLGIVDREEAWVPPSRFDGSVADAQEGATTGIVHPALDRQVTFRSTDPNLVAAIDSFIASGKLEMPDPPTETLIIDAEYESDGGIRVDFGDVFRFPTLDSCLLQITGVINRLTHGSGSCLTLHAGGVRSPDGEIVLIAAESGGGKSTLVGAFVKAGWDYLGDETIGVRPGGVVVGYPKRIGLDDVSRGVLGLIESSYLDNPVTDLRPDVVRLGGEVGLISRVVLVTYESGTGPQLELLGREEALGALIMNTLGFGADGDGGLAVLCGLSAAVPVQRITHDDAHAAVETLSAS